MPGWAPGCSLGTTGKKVVGRVLPPNTSPAPESSRGATPKTCGPTLTGMQARWTATPATSQATKLEVWAGAGGKLLRGRQAVPLQVAGVGLAPPSSPSPRYENHSRCHPSERSGDGKPSPYKL